MAVITISRQYGSGGWAAGEKVAARLRYRFVDQAMLDKVAQDAKVSVQSVQDIEKSAGDGWLSFFNELASSLAVVRHVPGISSEFDEEKYRLFLKRVILEVAARGDTVIVGRGAQMILNDRPDVIRISLVAKDEDRIKTLMKRYGYDEKKADTVAYREEKKRLAFLRGFGVADPEDPVLYHATINTSLVGDDGTADLICALAEACERKNGKK
jgi:cytidylate kinase